MKPGVIALLCALLNAMAGQAAAGSLADDINKLRRQGCEGRSIAAPLQESTDLDAVARQWSRGGRLKDALATTGYRAKNSASMRIEGAKSQAALVKALAANYCKTLTDPAFTTIGIAQRPGHAHIVLALPVVPPATLDSASINREVLDRVNTARGLPRKCGRTSFAAVPPLAASAMLNRAALAHAQDMATRNFFEHEGSDGSSASVRVGRTGYEWRGVGENIAAGPSTAAQVVDGWLESPGHCANIMNGTFIEMGIAFATNPKSDAGIYWAQVFATPRR